jgi:hypothetical protein
VVPIEWTAQARFVKELSLPAGRFVEVCGQLPAQAKVTWSFEAGSALDFNVHFHEGEQVHYPAKLQGVAKGNGVLDARTDQDYCWMWVNPSSREATLKLHLERQ